MAILSHLDNYKDLLAIQKVHPILKRIRFHLITTSSITIQSDDNRLWLELFCREYQLSSRPKFTFLYLFYSAASVITNRPFGKMYSFVSGKKSKNSKETTASFRENLKMWNCTLKHLKRSSFTLYELTLIPYFRGCK